MKKLPKLLKRAIIVCLSIGIVGCITVFGLDAYVRLSVNDRMLTVEESAQLENADCILVLGCYVYPNGTPSHMLEDRLKTGVACYKAGSAPKIVMSGDHGRTDYNEVRAMKDFAISGSVPSSDVFMDHAGFSTYESLYRLKEVFCADSVVIVSQGYHLYRALYIAEKLGIEAYGVSADLRPYRGALMRNVREIAARVKDFAMCIFKPEPTYLGKEIPVWGDGDATNDY